MSVRRLVEQCLKENPCVIDVRFDEPMSGHTAFKIGGPADCWVRPDAEGFPCFSAAILRLARDADIPVFILGGGANIVVSDRGIRGIVLDTGAWKGCGATEDGLSFRGGMSMDEATEAAAAQGFSGIEFLAGMPGSVGGAAWMNARCYGREIADVLAWADIIDFSADRSGFEVMRITSKAGFGYKRSPFQSWDCLILEAGFRLVQSDKDAIRHEMKKNRRDRRDKGHYRFPCAGSVFKNNPGFGKSTGQIIDELGLRGLAKGGARVSPFHGNIIINTGGASAADVRFLVDEVSDKVKARTGFDLEPEVLLVGEW
jgi:UDP-N-acetylmuramate dehydrogenase